MQRGGERDGTLNCAEFYNLYASTNLIKMREGQKMGTYGNNQKRVQNLSVEI